MHFYKNCIILAQ